MLLQNEIDFAFAATSAKIKACEKSNQARGVMSSNPLRHPGQGTQQPENDMGKKRFIQHVIDIMRKGEVFKPGNSQESEKEYSAAPAALYSPRLFLDSI